jgi:PII-like signaling protein
VPWHEPGVGDGGGDQHTLVLLFSEIVLPAHNEHGGEMLTKGPAKKVTIFINEDTQHHMTALHDSIMTFLMHKGVSGATATRAYSGFGSHQLLHTPKVEVLAQHLPIRIEFVETPEKVDEVLPTLYGMVSDGLIEVQDTTVVKLARKAPKPEPGTPHERKQGPAKLLRVFMGEADRWHDVPLYDAIVRKLLMMDIAGATVYRGILGYGAKGHQHKATFFHPTRDLPIMVSVIDTAEKISAAAQAVEEMLEDGLIVISDAEIVRLVRNSKATEAADAPGISS